MMNQPYEVEYCNLELRFERSQIRDFVKSLIHSGYSLYWSENEGQFIVSIQSGDRTVQLTFFRMGHRFKLVGECLLADERLVNLMEKMINLTRGHAVVKRFMQQEILIENIMFGEMVKQVSINGLEHRVLFEKTVNVTFEDMKKTFRSKRIEQRIPVLKMEIDYALACLHEAMHAEDKVSMYEHTEKLKELHHEMTVLEVW
jgi:hypothetical protein